MRKALLVATALGIVAAAALPATAADTTTTFTLTAGALNLTAPGSANLGNGAIGAPATGQLGSVTVTDARGSLTAQWDATVSSSDFTTGGGTAAETVGKAATSYWSGLAVSTTGTPVPVPGQVSALDAASLASPATAFRLLTGIGNNSVTWNPTLIVNVPATAVAGTYSGTVTHSVA
ncbi:MAG TPA: hypothetical protein VM433_13430 [Mycobacteriales bacterium]|nr:hypothetical protein [Mycobacteriales bacterium]